MEVGAENAVGQLPGPDMRSLSTLEILHAAASGGDYAGFNAEAVREVHRQSARGVDAVESTVAQLVACSRNLPEAEAIDAQLAIYEAAVRVCFSPSAAGQALDLLLTHPGALGSSEEAHSHALLFATACDRLDDLLQRLRSLGAAAVDADSQFVNRLACAKLSLVCDDPIGLADNAKRAADVAVREEDAERARRLRRVAHWLVPSRDHRISQWRLGDLHHLIPREAAECLEQGDLAGLDGVETPAAVLESLTAARGMLRAAGGIIEDPNGRQPLLRNALASWAMQVGGTIMDSNEADSGAAVPFTGTAWRLLEPEPPASVIEAHARAVALACASMDELDVVATAEQVAEAMPASERHAAMFVPAVLQAWKESQAQTAGEAPRERIDLVRRLHRASRDRPWPSLDSTVQEVANRLTGVSGEVKDTIESCLLDRRRLLPDEPPFRGRMWFESGVTHRRYQEGRDELDLVASYKAFEEAWRREPNNWVAIQGLILGLRRRLGQKPARDHLLQHLARLLDHVAEREVEAALAYASLADLALLARRWRDRRRYLDATAAALARRVRRQPWTRARNAQIALQLELGNLVAAGDAAWDESRMHLPGSAASRRYALLAATLWERTGDTGQSLASSIDRAQRHAASPSLTTRAAVKYAALARRLVVLSDLQLDDDALEDLWWACRGNEDDLRRFLEQQGTREIDPRPQYLAFLARKLGMPHLVQRRVNSWRVG